MSAVVPGWDAAAQSGRQPPKKTPEKKTDAQPGPGKGTTPEKPEDQEPLPPIPKGQQDEPPLKLSTQVVNVEATVIDKKTKRLVPGLTKKNFIIYEDGIKQEVTNFAPGEGPMTAVLLLDNGFHNRYFQDYFTPSRTQEIFLSASAFLQGVKQNDFVALVTFSLKPKVIQDFTGDREKLHAALISAYRDLLNFSESNIYDALSFVLLGGKAIQLYEEDAGPSEYIGLQEVEGHTAVILVTTGIDTFSRITYDKALKIVSNAGVPIFTIGVGNLFFKKYEGQLPPESRLTFLQAQNSLRSFAEKTGGSYFEMTFEGEIPGIMRTISALLRSQYSLGYTPTNTRRAGKERKIKLDVDIDGDGNPETSHLELRYRRGYYEVNDNAPDKGKK
jgi:VWFA-related protein